MKTDLYTKTVLTVIAVALIGIVVQNVSLTPTAHAQSGVADVRIVGITKPIRNPGFNWQPLPVDVTKVLSTGIPVSSKLPIDINVYKTFCVIGLANAEEPRHHCISVGFVHNPPEITVNAYGHRLSAIFRALSRKRSIKHRLFYEPRPETPRLTRPSSRNSSSEAITRADDLARDLPVRASPRCQHEELLSASTWTSPLVGDHNTYPPIDSTPTNWARNRRT